jgi:ABC-type sugar transport system ATPase subunit
VDLEVRPGRVHSLLGANGAGKSTLLKIVSGATRPDGGRFTLDDQPLDVGSLSAARRAGVVMVHQEITLVPQRSAVRNVTLGSLRSRAGLIQRRDPEEAARRHLDEVGFRGSLDAPVSQLSVGKQQLVEIAKGLMGDARVIALDEPTSALSPVEVEHLFEIVRKLAERGTAIIYVSHRLDEVLQISQDISILRGGRIVTRYHDDEICGVTKDQLVEDMMGSPVRHLPPSTRRATDATADPVLRVHDVRRAPGAPGVSLTIQPGEIVGLFGLVGAGRSEFARAVFGLDPAHGGQVQVAGRVVRGGPRAAIRGGIAFLPEDRKTQGLVLSRTIAANVMLPFIPHRMGFFRREAQAAAADKALVDAKVNKPPTEIVGNLSGGNQQKVLLARWMAKDFAVFIFDEPTRGIDVATRNEIYTLMEGLAESGAALLVISSETAEILRISHRCLVMHEGRIVSEFTDVPSLTERMLLGAASNVDLDLTDTQDQS